jgi:hypothetical protein
VKLLIFGGGFFILFAERGVVDGKALGMTSAEIDRNQLAY